MKKYFLALLFFGFFVYSLTAQNKQFYDRLGEQSSESSAYFYQVKESGDSYKCYYISNDQLFFEGRIIQSGSSVSSNKYAGKCKWYYKDGVLKSVVNYNSEGVKDGESVDYYESGKVWKRITYNKGKIKGNKYKEFEEDGRFANVFHDQFDNNISDWALYATDLSEASISDGALMLNSKSSRGTARFLSLSSSKSFSFEVVIKGDDDARDFKRGMIYGFKNWDNYSYFLVKGNSVFVGSVFEGVNSLNIEGMYDESVSEVGDNNIKIISVGDLDIFSVNGKVVYKRDKLSLLGSNFGVIVSGEGQIVVDEVVHKEIESNGGQTSDEDLDVKASGSGVLLSSNGYVLTNQHVVDGANGIMVEIHSKGTKKSYNAKVIQTDAVNDLVILKIDDASFSKSAEIKYSLASKTQDVGTSVYTLGYPLALSGLGNEVKFVDGKISSKTGYENALNSYQTSVPVQPGNSGGPLFNLKGELVGVVNAKISGADNVSYVIKMNYIKSLFEVLPETLSFGSTNKLNGLSVEDQVKALKELVVLVKIK